MRFCHVLAVHEGSYCKLRPFKILTCFIYKHIQSFVTLDNNRLYCSLLSNHYSLCSAYMITKLRTDTKVGKEWTAIYQWKQELYVSSITIFEPVIKLKNKV